MGAPGNVLPHVAMQHITVWHSDWLLSMHGMEVLFENGQFHANTGLKDFRLGAGFPALRYSGRDFLFF